MKFLENSNITISEPKQLAKVFQDLLKLEDNIDIEKEHFYVMHMDTRNKVKMVELVALGILNSALVHPREVYRRAILEGSAQLVIAHNHPSGDPEPSDDDIKITKQLTKAGEIIGITTLDHVIFTHKNEGFYSFRNNKKNIKREGVKKYGIKFNLRRN